MKKAATQSSAKILTYPIGSEPELDQRHALHAAHGGVKINSFEDFDKYYTYKKGNGTVEYFAKQNSTNITAISLQHAVEEAV